MSRGPDIPLSPDGLDPRLVREAQEIARLRASPLSLDEWVELRDAFEAGRRAHAGESALGDQLGLLPKAETAGSLVLWSPTIAARLYLRRIAKWTVPPDWEERKEEYVTLLSAWILAHARDAEGLAALNEETAPLLVRDLEASLDCTPEELDAAIGRVVRGVYPEVGEDEDEAAQAEVDWALVLVALCEIGGSPEEWLYSPESRAWWVLEAADRRRRKAAEAEGDPAPPGPTDPRVIASARWNRVKEKLLAAGPGPEKKDEDGL